jgi:3-oxoacyl-[acyl-carrier protein] reductase
VNNAGIYEFLPLEAITPEHFHKHFDLNVLGLLLTTQEAVKLFTPEGGSIINLSSVVTRLSFPASTVYTGSKAAVEAATRTLAMELGPRKIRVNAIGPGMVETEGVHTAGILDSPMHKEYVAKAPLGRIGQPADIASAVVFLATDESSWITGETFFVTGGYR